jgi:plasmid stabilization system protein ParE
LAHFLKRISEDNPSAARRVGRTIYEGVAALRNFPNRGRLGVVPGTRELVFAPLPYIAVYEIVENQAFILRIRHTAQNWP